MKTFNFLFHCIRLSVSVNLALEIGREVKIHEKEIRQNGDSLTWEQRNPANAMNIYAQRDWEQTTCICSNLEGKGSVSHDVGK